MFLGEIIVLLEEIAQMCSAPLALTAGLVRVRYIHLFFERFPTFQEYFCLMPISITQETLAVLLALNVMVRSSRWVLHHTDGQMSVTPIPASSEIKSLT